MLDYVILKVNTTGLNLDEDKVTEFCLLHIVGEEVVDSLVSLVDPGRDIPALVQSLTGITPLMVEGKPLLPSFKERILSFIEGKFLVGHSVNFDISFLEQELSVKFDNKVIDTCNIARSVIPFSKTGNYRLPTLCKLLNLEDSHTGAERSARLIAKLFQKLVERHQTSEKAHSEEI